MSSDFVERPGDVSDYILRGLGLRSVNRSKDQAIRRARTGASLQSPGRQSSGMKDRRDYRTGWLFRFCSPPWIAMVAGDKLTSAVPLLEHIDSEAPEATAG